MAVKVFFCTKNCLPKTVCEELGVTKMVYEKLFHEDLFMKKMSVIMDEDILLEEIHKLNSFMMNYQ